MFLVLTADQRFWKTDEKILFLGEWCRLYRHKPIWSGLDAEVLPYHWDDREIPIGSEELAETLGPLMDHCIQQFGPSRCMFESNFPVDKISYSYNVVFNAFKRLSKSYSASERAAMFHDTATRVYRIRV